MKMSFTPLYQNTSLSYLSTEFVFFILINLSTESENINQCS